MKKKGFTPPYVLAAQITFLISTFWVLSYILTYSWGITIFGSFSGPSIYEIITTSVTRADQELATIALFIIISRYLLSFGILWPIISWILGILYNLTSRSTKKSKVRVVRNLDS